MSQLSIKRTRHPRTTAAQRQEWTEKYKSSGLTVPEFSQKHRMGRNALYRWLREDLKSNSKSAPPIGWQELPTAGIIPPTSAWAAELALSNGHTLRLSVEAAQAFLPAWLEKASPC
jgi:hypothetical protein